MFTNFEVIMRMYLVAGAVSNSNCTGERVYFVLKRVKSYLRSIMETKRPSSSTLFTIEAELIKGKQLDFNDTINILFAYQKSRKRKV